ncbi:photosystem I reaction center subunit XI [Pleurocapsa sp. PCC 7319]|uniref:photosystem I reaction center subunit XI n=1 Tax=Pleurocapsa sp. PCC 7319 TaxID=118161 RepID=UPI00034C1045|nr:photosystem I reaction center subunit XI [Pleurocapsa sp. PCC 7319]
MDAITSGGDPQVGNLATPLNSSDFSTSLIRNLPAYREGLAPLRRGLEVGMAHGYLLYGPFLVLGPLRNTENADIAALLASIGLVAILTLCLSLYASAMGGKPSETLTAPKVPAAFASKEGWSEFGTGFFLGGTGGAFFAYFLLSSAYLGDIKSLMGL